MGHKPRLDDYDQLTVPEKILRLQELWDDLAAREEDIELTPAQTKELEGRMKDYERDPTNGTPWPEVKDRIRKRKPAARKLGSQ